MRMIDNVSVLFKFAARKKNRFYYVCSISQQFATTRKMSLDHFLTQATGRIEDIIKSR